MSGAIVKELPNDCWLFAGSFNHAGYGVIYTWQDGKNKTDSAHRTMYENVKGRIPEGLELDHLCRVRHCINPDHLEAVTRRENMLRTQPYRIRTHCRKGHELTSNNVYVAVKNRKTGRIGRQCRQCAMTRYRRRYYLKVKEEITE